MKGLILAVLLIALVLGGGWALGWFSFSDSPTDSSLHIDKPKVKRDVQQAGEAARETAKDAAEKAKIAVGHAKDEAENASRKVQESEPKDSDEHKTQPEKTSAGSPGGE